MDNPITKLSTALTFALLAQHFLTKIAEQNNTAPAQLNNDALRALQEYSYPGNVRELENIIERAFTLCDRNIISEQDLQFNSSEKNSIVHQPETFQLITDEATQADESNHIKHSNSSPSAQALSGHQPNSPQQNSNQIGPRAKGQSLEDYLEQIERKEIEHALLETKWNRTAAAKRLGISFRALRYKLKKLELD